MRQLAGIGAAGIALTRSAGRLPAAGARVDDRRLGRRARRRRGFVLVRGLPVERYTEDGGERSPTGGSVSTSACRSRRTPTVTCSAMSATPGADPDDPSVRLYRTRARAAVSTPMVPTSSGSCACRTLASGERRASSARSPVFNEVARRRPDLVAADVRAVLLRSLRTAGAGGEALHRDADRELLRGPAVHDVHPLLHRAGAAPRRRAAAHAAPSRAARSDRRDRRVARASISTWTSSPGDMQWLSNAVDPPRADRLRGRSRGAASPAPAVAHAPPPHP